MQTLVPPSAYVPAPESQTYNTHTANIATILAAGLAAYGAAGGDPMARPDFLALADRAVGIYLARVLPNAGAA